MLLDLYAAFDTIDYDKLLNLLSSHFCVIGSALEWIKSYLTYRKIQSLSMENASKS